MGKTTMTTTMLYDADCGICTAAAAWLARRATPGQLTVLPLQAVGAGSEPGLVETLRGRNLAQTLHVVTADGRVLTGSRAVLAAARTVRGLGAARLADHRAGHVLWEPAYRWVARNRRGIGRAFGLEAACALPAQERPGAPGRSLR